MIKGFKRTLEPHEEWDAYCEQNETYKDMIENQDVYIAENDIDKRLKWIYKHPKNIEQMRENWRYVQVWKNLLSLKGERHD